ncbi:hypothetical protein ACIQVU_01005 [Lysinibacillus sp. NPDC098008]|uniref:hypothetical protein n=1 Tax=Lysinibacillus sp. NPDC098008 TaxID=3364146 RepID=UPI003826A683
MIHFAWNRIKNRKFASITIILAFLAVFLLIPIGLDNTKETKLAVQSSIADHGRGSYDLLVRPKNSRTAVEKKAGIVEENYIGDGQGGISIEEWQNLKANPAIEVAAPVASIGYFTGKQLSVELPQLEQSTRFTWEFYTTDGYKDYMLSPPRSFIYFKESQPGNVQYLKNLTLGESASGATMEIMLPTAYHLLAAIDIESEEKLTNINFSQLKNDIDPLELQAIQGTFGNVPIIKVIQREDIQVPLTLKLKAEVLELDIEEYRQKLGLSQQDWLMASEESAKQQVIAELNQKEAVTAIEREIDLSSFQRPFDGTPVKINDQLKAEKADNFVASRGETPVFFTAQKLDYDLSDEVFKINIVEEGSPPSYKKIEHKGRSLYESQEIPYLLEQVGTFLPTKTESNQLSSSPLGIYSTASIQTIQGHILKPTTIPGSFIPQPAGALISLESAEMIKGPKPIDAIRIRVAGIQAYNDEAQAKIEKVAIDLLQLGYEVDIVAGSSFVNQTLDVEGIGQVVAPWTTLGVAQELEENWNHLTFMTTVLFIAFAFVWFVARLLFEKNLLKNEDELLRIMGWQRKQIIQRNYIEQYTLLFVAYILSLLLMPFLSLKTSAYWLATIIFVIFIGMLSFVFAINKQEKKRLIAYKRAYSFLYYWKILMPTMIVLYMSSILLIIQTASIGTTIINAQQSSLGQFTVDATLWFQLAILLSTFILSILGLSECLHALFQTRRTELEMYHTIGWTRAKIVMHLCKEVFLWTGITIIAGAITGFIVLTIMKFPGVWIVGSILTALFLLSIVVGGLTIFKTFLSPQGMISKGK